MRTHGAFPVHLIHGVNARGMQIKRCTGRTEKEEKAGEKKGERRESEREARNATKPREEASERERAGEKDAYCERRKRRLKQNTKFARVICTAPLLSTSLHYERIHAPASSPYLSRGRRS